MFLVGSQYFFKDYPDFNPKDKDILKLVEKPNGFNIFRQISLTNKCVFEWKKMSPKAYINFHKKQKTGMLIGKFLIPEFCKEIGFTIEHLKELEPMLENLDDKHKYEIVIYNSYIENNDFVLTQEQRDLAYKIYKGCR